MSGQTLSLKSNSLFREMQKLFLDIGKGILSNSRIIRTDDKEFDISEIEFDRRAKLVSWEYIDVQSIMTYVDERIG